MKPSRRLIIDTLRRMWLMYAIAVGMIFSLAGLEDRVIADGFAPHSFRIFAWSMAASWFLAFAPTIALQAREITLLPASRRELWISRWWLGVAVPAVTMVMAAGMVSAVSLSFGGSGAGPERLALVLIYCAVYGGCMMAVTTLMTFVNIEGGEKGTGPVIRALLQVLVIPLGGAALPLWFAKYLPLTFSDLGGPASGWLIAGVGVTIASYFHHPRIVERGSRARIASATRASSYKPDRLSGVSLLFWREGLKSLTLYLSFLTLAIVYSRIFTSGTFAEFLQSGRALIFSTLPAASAGHFPAIVMFITIGNSDMGALGDMRALRALPMSSTRLAALLTGLAAMTATTLWIALLAAHVIAARTGVDSLRPELWLVVAGAVALSGATRLALPGHQLLRIVMGGIVVVPLIVFQLLNGPVATPILIGGGSAALMLSFWLNRRTLRRGGQIYKPQSTIAVTSS